MKKKIYMWCFQNKKTKKFEPMEWTFRHWYYGYGMFCTKKDLMDNAYNEIPDGYTPVRVEIKLIKKLT